MRFRVDAFLRSALHFHTISFHDSFFYRFIAWYCRIDDGWRQKNMDWREHIEQRPGVMLGKPVIKGTRLTVELIIEELAEGATEADLLDAHPRLRPEHIRAALAYAAASLSSELTIFQDAAAG